jgi:competence protein ComEA
MTKLLSIFVALMMMVGTASFAVDLNKATQAELEALKGIGEVKAKAIIDYRTKNGPFKSADDLDKVKGVGKGIIAKIGGDVTIDGKALGVPTASDKPAEKKTTKSKKAEESAPAAAAATAAADEKTVKPEKKKKEKDKE